VQEIAAYVDISIREILL